MLALGTGEVIGGSELCIKPRPDRRVLGDISPLVSQAPWQLWALLMGIASFTQPWQTLMVGFQLGKLKLKEIT